MIKKLSLPKTGICFALLMLLPVLPGNYGLAATHMPDDAGSAQSVRGAVNAGGPESWPEDQGLSTSINGAQGIPAYSPPPLPPDQQDFSQNQPGNFHAPNPAPTPQMPEPAPGIQPPVPVSTEIPAPTQAPASQAVAPLPDPMRPPVAPNAAASQPAPSSPPQTSRNGRQISGNVAPVPGQTPEPQERPVIYVDEAGNPVAKPPEPDKMYAEATALMEQGKYEDALPILQELKALPQLSSELREKVLYSISDAAWERYANNPLAGYEPIVSSTNEAMNANLRSTRIPDAMLRLGLANINVGNLEEGGAYVTGLMRRFPDFPGVAQGLNALGQAQLKNGRNADAERSFGTILDKYPESSQLQDASVGLAHALVNQGKDNRAQIILDFISKRWPRYYINDPDFLLTQARNNEKTGHLDEAMAWYWLYVNLNPGRPENGPLLLKMADVYMKDGNPEAADFIYATIRENLPDTPPAITSRIRMAEHGIHDSPISYEEMSKVFSANGKQELWPVYADMGSVSSNNPDIVLAHLKKAMWQYWDKQYPEAMGSAADFIDNFPEHGDISEARNILWESFQKELAQSLGEHNYGRILLLWNGFPYVRERYGKIDPPLRYALAQGWQERGDDQKSFELLSDFLKDPMDPQYGEAAFSQFFNRYLQNSQWDKILDLGEKVKNWRLSPELAAQLEYAQALSAQNLNMGAAALNRWKKLAQRTDIPLYQQAYATYFLAKDAENRRDIRDAYELNRKVVEMFSKLSDERSDKADPERIKEGVASLMDICEVGNRVPEALQWLERYNAYAPTDSPEYPGLRFREARLYRKLGDNARAQALLEDISSRFPESPFAQAASAELRTFDVSRDLQRYVSGAPRASQSNPTGSTSGNWSSTAPAQ